MKNKFRRFMACLLVLMLVSSDIAVLAEEVIKTLTLPAALQIIDKEAFYGNTSIEKIVVPDGTTEIRSRAFANSSLTEIELPDTLMFIADDAFENCTDFDIIAEEGSYAYAWAVEMGYIATEEIVASGTCGSQVIWELDVVGTLTIKGTGTMTNYSSMSAPWYAYRDSIVNIIVEDGVSSIGDYTFYGCTKATAVSIPDSVITLGKGAFSNCQALTGVSIPDSVTAMGAYAFAQCPRMTTVTISENVTAISECAFIYCTGLTNMAIPENIVSIGRYAFHGCSNLISINLPEGINSIVNNAFEGCTKLTAIVCENSYAHVWCKNNGVNYTLGTIEPTVTPGTTVTPEPTATPVPDFTYQIVNSKYAKITKYTGSSTAVVVPESIAGYPVTEIGSSAFSWCNNVISVELPEDIVTIGQNAFEYCDSLTSISLPNSMTTLGDNAFFFCTSLADIELPEKLNSIGKCAFAYCPLGNINIPASVASIGTQPFIYCKNLEAIEVDSGNKVYTSKNGVLFTKDMKTLLICPQKKIEKNYFVPDGVTAIADSAFSRCAGVENVVLPTGVISIGKHAFHESRGLMSIELPEGLTTIGYAAFYYCDGLKKVTLPESVTTIGASCFMYCYGLTEINLPENISFIGNEAFYGCGNPKVFVVENSYAHEWCAENGVSYVLAGSVPTVTPTATSTPNPTVTPTPTPTLEPTATPVPTPMPEAMVDSETGFEYCSFDGINCTITDYVGSNSEIVVPEKISGFTVNEIGIGAFANKSEIKNVILPETITRIDLQAFAYCGISEITIPKNVEFVAEAAFDGADLVRINVTEGNEAYCSVDGVLFSQDQTLLHTFPQRKEMSHYVVPNGVTRIADFAFQSAGLTGVTIAESVVEIGQGAFGNCGGLQTVYIPKNVRAMAEDTFTACQQLTEIVVDAQNLNYCSVDGVLFTKDLSTLCSYPIGKNNKAYTAPEGVKYIAVNAFAISNLESVMLPDGVLDISIYAFAYSRELTKIRIPVSVQSISENAFLGIDAQNLTIYGEIGSYAEKFADDNGITFVAGNIPESICEHANTRSEYLKTTYAQINGNEEQHQMIKHYKVICDECNATLDADYTTTTAENHAFDANGKCNLCDYQKCQHSDTSNIQFGETIYNMIAGDDEKHQVEKHYKVTCIACGEILDDDLEELTTEDHTFDQDEKCTVCGYEKNCSHTWTLDCGEFSCEMIIGNEQQHETISVSWKECRACGEVVGEKTEVRNYEDHSFDELGWCADCGYQLNDQPTENPMEGYPTITSVDTIDSYSLKINWTQVVGAEGYRIWRENAATGEGEYLDDVIGGTVCSYTDTELEPNTTYAYTVAAYAHAVTENAIYISLDSNTVEGTTSEEVVSELAAPIINEIELRDATSLTIRWSEVENAEGFLIYRADSADGEFVEIDRYNFVYQHHVDRDLATGKTYYYKVQAFAYSESGRMYTGAMSAAVAGTPALDNPMNGVPTITVAEALDCTRVKITWTSVEDAEGYNLRREDLVTGKTASTRINSANTLTYIDTGLSPATTYAYTLEAYAKALVTDTTYISEDSNTVNVTTETEAVIELDTPDIDDISVLSGNMSVSIKWTSISNATGYYLYRSTNTSDNFEIVQTINGATATTDTQLIQGTKYYYRVQAYAVGSAGTVFTSEWSGKFAVTMPETIEAPTIYVIACGPSSISITWNEISNAEDYLVYRSYTKDSGFTKIAETKDPFYIDSNVAVDIQVFYKVKARTANGLTSSYSNRDSDYIDPEDYAEEIDAPDVTSITVLSGTSLKVRWSFIDNAVKYYIYRSTQGASKGFEKIGEATGQVFTDTGLSPNTKYWYRIRAISGSGTESVLGVTDSATTSSGSGGSDYEDILVTSVVIDPGTLNLSIGETYSLYANIRPSNATNPSVNWKSNNTAVATVSASGKVTAVKEGTATITATAADGSGKADTCLVTVTAATAPVVSTPSVSGYSLTPSVVAVGETFKLNGILSGNGAIIEKITISAFPAGRHADDGVRVYTYAPKTETYNLNNVPAIKTGYTYTDSEGDSMSLDAGESYDILIYVALSNGEYFRNNSNPSQTVTVTAAATTEPFVRVYGVDNADLNGKTLSFAYNKFSGKTIYVLTNIDIMPWSSDEDAFNITYQSVEYTDEGTLYELAVNGSENPYADQRTGELRIYENGKVSTTSPWATIKVKQAGNPNVPVIVSAALDDDGVTFHRGNGLQLVVGDHNDTNGFELIVNLDNSVPANWTVYTDDTEVARAYRGTDDGLVYIHAKACGTTSLYISHVYEEEFADVDKELLFKVCDISVIARQYRALIFGTGTGVENDNGEDAGITFTRALKNQFSKNVYSDLDIEIITSYSGNEAKLTSMINEFAQIGSESDITYVCCMSHGYSGGLALWTGGYIWNDKTDTWELEYSNLSYDVLFERLSRIPGKVVFITGACMSGSAISVAKQYGSKFSCLTAADDGVLSWSSAKEYVSYTAANVIFIDGLLSAASNGDIDADGVVTIREAYSYAKKFSDEAINRMRTGETLPPYIRVVNDSNSTPTTVQELIERIELQEFLKDCQLMNPQFYGDGSIPLWGNVH